MKRKISYIVLFLTFLACGLFANVSEFAVLEFRSAKTYNKVFDYVSSVDKNSAIMMNMFSAMALGAPNFDGIDTSAPVAVFACADESASNISVTGLIKATDSSAPAAFAKMNKLNTARVGQWLAIEFVNASPETSPLKPLAKQLAEKAEKIKASADVRLCFTYSPLAKNAVSGSADILTDKFRADLLKALDQLADFSLSANFNSDNAAIEFSVNASEGTELAKAFNEASKRMPITEANYLDTQDALSISMGSVNNKAFIPLCDGPFKFLLDILYSPQDSQKILGLAKKYLSSADGTFASVERIDGSDFAQQTSASAMRTNMPEDEIFGLCELLICNMSPNYEKIFKVDSPEMKQFLENAIMPLKARTEIIPAEKFGVRVLKMTISAPETNSGSGNEPAIRPTYIAKKENMLFSCNDEASLKKMLSAKDGAAVSLDSDSVAKINIGKLADILLKAAKTDKSAAAKIIPDLQIKTYFGQSKLSLKSDLSAQTVKEIVELLQTAFEKNAKHAQPLAQ